MKTSRATGSPFAADSCNIKLIRNSKASENVQFLKFYKVLPEQTGVDKNEAFPASGQTPGLPV